MKRPFGSTSSMRPGHASAFLLLLLLASCTGLPGPVPAGETGWTPSNQLKFQTGGGSVVHEIELPANARVLSTSGSIRGQYDQGVGFCAVDYGSAENLSVEDGNVSLAMARNITSFQMSANWTYNDAGYHAGRVILNRSGGYSYSAPVGVDDAYGHTSYMYPSVAVSANGTVYAAWGDMRTGKWAAYFASSTDNGTSFGPNIQIPGSEYNEKNTPSPLMAIGPEGDIHLAWTTTSGGAPALHSASLDGGRTFGSPTGINMPVESMVIDSAGTIHLVRGNSYTRSTDGGATFRQPIQMYTLPFFGAAGHASIGVDGQDRLFTAFYAYPGNTYDDYVYAAVSEDGGRSFTPHDIGYGMTPSVLVGMDNKVYLIFDSIRGGANTYAYSDVTKEFSPVATIYGGGSARALDNYGRIHAASASREVSHKVYDLCNNTSYSETVGPGTSVDMAIDRNGTVHLVCANVTDPGHNDVYFIRGRPTFLSAGNVTAGPIELGALPLGLSVNYSASLPEPTGINIFYRSTDDLHFWSGWEEVANGSPARSLNRYVQLRFELRSADPLASPGLSGFTLDYTHYSRSGSLFIRQRPTAEDVAAANFSCTSRVNGQEYCLTVSNDGGLTRQAVLNRIPFQFPTAGRELWCELRLCSDGRRTPNIREIKLEYTVVSNPTNVTVGLAGSGPPLWSVPGRLGVPETLPDLAEAFNGYLAAHPDRAATGTVRVPLELRSETCGIVFVDGFSVRYGLPPRVVMRLPVPANLTLPDNTPMLFSVRAVDDDLDQIRYFWYLDLAPIDGPNNTHMLDPGSVGLGNHTLQVFFSDGLFELNETWNITVVRANRPPAITVSSPRQAVEMTKGDKQRFMVKASDPENDPLTYRWWLDASPVGSNASGFELDTTGLGTGNHGVKVVVSDGRSETERSWSVRLMEKNKTTVNYAQISAGVIFLLVLSAFLYRSSRRRR